MGLDFLSAELNRLLHVYWRVCSEPERGLARRTVAAQAYYRLLQLKLLSTS